MLEKKISTYIQILINNITTDFFHLNIIYIELDDLAQK